MTDIRQAIVVGQRTEGVLGRRFLAYLVDILVIFGLTLVVGFAVLILGVVTFGLAWMLFAILVPATAILYSAITIAGSEQGTIGMRMAGVRVVRASDGGRVDWITAAVHALLFYVAAGTLLILVDVVIGLARDDRRMARDLLVGVTALRREGA
jgi:uncharacterized RDD family membrane protein YckC